MNGPRFKRFLAGMCLLVLSSGTAWSQKITATMRGDVTDPSGAAVAGAKVVVRNQATNAERDAVTNDRGAYVVDLLPAGLYDVSIEHEGFNRRIFTGLRPRLIRTSASTRNSRSAR
jgi:hypothetical protein